MFGAILGDIIGSRFEFDRGPWTKEFELFTEKDHFTDDTVMTIAVCEALIAAGPQAGADEIRNAVIKSMREWGGKYPHAGYGGMFRKWLFGKDKNPKPYGSYGNGAPMRVSAAGWLYDTLEDTLTAAAATADVTHNHPEAVKAAQCTAAVIFLARKGASLDRIEAYIQENYDYDLAETLDHMRARHCMDASCQDTMPKALNAFLRADSFEDTIRNAVSLGGDTDTIAAIAGSMAEAYFGTPVTLVAEGMKYLPEDICRVVNTFNDILGRGTDENDLYADNRYIKLAAREHREKLCNESFATLFSVLAKRMSDDGQAPAPMIDANHVMEDLVRGANIGDTVSLEEDMRLVFERVTDGSGAEWFPLFTDPDELSRGSGSSIVINAPIRAIIENGLHAEGAAGIVINPFTEPVAIPKELLKMLVE